MHHKIKIEIRHSTLDGDGKRILTSSKWKPANSLLGALIKRLWSAWQNYAANIVDTGGTSRSIAASTQDIVTAPADTTTYGIVVGTGTNPVTIDDYKLQTQVTTNIGHYATTTSLENPDANTWRVNVVRQINNNTGSPLAITEVALYVTNSGAAYKLCFDRSLYNLTIPNGAARVITYRISATI